MKFSLVIPAKNEEKRIILPLLEYYAALHRRFGSGNFEIIIVINNTTDRSAHILNRVVSILKTKDIKIYDIGSSEAKGRAVIYGLRKARGKVVGFTDADGSYSPHEILKLYRKLAISGADAIIPNRYSNESVLLGNLPAERKLYSRLFNWFIRLAFGITTADTQGGLKLFTRDAVKLMLPNIVTFGWTCDVNMLLALRNARLSVMESPVTWRQEEGSTVSLSRHIFSILSEVLTLLKRQYVKRPLVALNIAKP